MSLLTFPNVFPPEIMHRAAIDETNIFPLGILWWLWPLRGPGSSHWALLGGVGFALLGGGVAALPSGASLVCKVFP